MDSVVRLTLALWWSPTRGLQPHAEVLVFATNGKGLLVNMTCPICPTMPYLLGERGLILVVNGSLGRPAVDQGDR